MPRQFVSDSFVHPITKEVVCGECVADIVRHHEESRSFVRDLDGNMGIAGPFGTKQEAILFAKNNFSAEAEQYQRLIEERKNGISGGLLEGARVRAFVFQAQEVDLLVPTISQQPKDTAPKPERARARMDETAV